MRTFTSNRTIAAPVHEVFDTVAHVERFKAALPHIIEVEFLTEEHTGVGTRFRETRLMRGKEASTELEVTEYVPHSRVRLVADAGGTIWDTVFSVRPKGQQTELSMVMEARPHKLGARIVTPLIAGTVSKAIAVDMDAVKAHCESGSAG